MQNNHHELDERRAWQILRAAAQGEPTPEMSADQPAGWTLQPSVGPGVAVVRRLLPFLQGTQPVVFGHLAQSVDGAIATRGGESRWISGPHDLTHTHQLRALAHAVIVGVGTVTADRPQLTVRRVQGPNPIRVVIDPSCRLADLDWANDPDTTLVICDGERQRPVPGATVVPLPATGGLIDPHAVVSALSARGLRRLLVEGGGVTVSRFIQAHAMDRLHLVVAPVLVGGGRQSLPMELGDLSDCPRPAIQVSPLGGDWLFDCSFGCVK